MRLTLRTMLAYMDGLLSQEDAQDIGKRIEDSKQATDLYHRIRDVVRRLRLTAPSLSERGPGLDPNTVAEYLDNVLPADRMPDFEKVCLESDVHLAEVAASHQILALVLGEPAEIDPESREKMYQLPKLASQDQEERRAVAAVAAMLAGGDGASASPADPHKGRPRPAVPEYLREPRKRQRFLPTAAALFLVGGFIGIVLFALGQFDRDSLIGHWIYGPEQPAQVAEKNKDLGLPTPDLGKGKTPAAKSPTNGGQPDSGTKPLSPAAGQPDSKDPTAGPEAPRLKTDTLGPPTLPGQENTTPPLEPEPKRPAAGPADPREKSLPKPDELAKVDPNDRVGPKAPVVPEIISPDDLVARPAVPPKLPVDESGVKVPPKETPKPLEESARAGRFMSDGLQVLLKYNAPSSTWNRVVTEEFLPSGQPLLAMPTYRPRLVLLKSPAAPNAEVTVELHGGTRVSLLPPDGQGHPGIELVYGRLLLKPFSGPDVRVRLSAGGHSGLLTLKAVETIAAVEVNPSLLPGVNPETEPSHREVALGVAQGEVIWEESGKPPVHMTAPAQWSMATPADALWEAPGAKEAPKWVTTDMTTALDRRAGSVVAQAFPADRSASLTLMEFSEHRQTEVRWMAARSLAYLGQFEPLVAVLNDAQIRWQWPEYVDLLRQAAARGPETAAAIRQAFEKVLGKDGTLAYRMLWSYTDKNLRDGEDATLVQTLENENLALRILAFWNLKELTGFGFWYRPEAPAAKRQPSVARWREAQRLGQLRARTVEEKSRVASDAGPGGTEQLGPGAKVKARNGKEVPAAEPQPSDEGGEPAPLPPEGPANPKPLPPKAEMVPRAVAPEPGL